MLHAFYIIHTNKYDKKARRQTPQSSQSPETQQRYSHLPSLPHPDRYRPPASYSPYEDHPPPVPPKREDTLPYDLALHPNASGTNIGRAKAVLHTYQIPESTLHPPPISSRPRRRVPSPEPPRPDPEPEPAPESAPEPTPEPEPEAPSRPQPQLQTQSEPPPAAPPLDPNDPNAPLPYPAEYHPNASGQNVAKAKAVLHTYQIPEITFPAPESEPLLPAAEQDKPNQLHPATGLKSKSMWSLRRRGKGLSTLDVNSPTAIPSPGSLSPRPKWQAGPSWIRRLRRPEQVNPATTDEDDGPSTMVMVWDDKFDRLRPPNKSPENAGRTSGHAKSASEPVELPFPMPPGSVRPVVDRTGTSNTILRRLGSTRSESALGAVTEEPPQPEEVMSEGEGASNAKEFRWEDGGRLDPSTDTEMARPQRRLMSRLSRRARPRLDLTAGTPGSAPPTVLASGHSASSTQPPPKPDSPNQNQNRGISSPLSRHIAPPAVLASSIDESRVSSGLFRRSRTSRSTSPTSPVSPTRSSVDIRIAEFGLGRGGDAYSAGSRALRSGSRDQHDRERRTSLGTLPSPFRSPNRLSFGTATSPTSDMFGGTGSSMVPVIRRGLTQGTFGTGITSTTATSEEGPVAGKTSPGGENSKNEDDVQDEEELSQDEQVERWIKREDERRSQSESQPPTSHGHSSLRVNSPCGPDEASIFSEESSGFAGIGVASAQEKGRAGRIELWDRPDWDGSNPSASPEGSAQQQHARYHDEDPFRNPPPPTATHPPHATGQQSPQVPPLSPPTSPRASRPTRPPPPVPPETPVPAKPAPLRMDTFGVGERPSFGLLSPPATERVKGKGKERAISPPPPVPVRPGATQARPQSPQLPPKPAILRSMSGGDEDDLSAVYIRALRDEL
ncbi:hypothetical protein FRC08_001469 [Ceratobasidium sp. 394]|nr:hypothetical protein FRC08_001469 [Ceratobasidium sp. 394]